MQGPVTWQPRAVGEKERAIFEAVFQLLSEGREFHDLKVAEIAARAGIGKGTVYEYFPCKEAILPRAIVYRLGQGFEAAGRLLAQEIDFQQLLARLLDGAAAVFTNANTSAGALIAAVLRQGPKKQEDTRPFARWCSERMAELCEKLASRGKAVGAVREDIAPEYLRFCFSAAASAYVQQLGCDPNEQNRDKIRWFAVQMFLTAVGRH